MSRKTLLAFVILALLGSGLVSWSAPAQPAKDKEAPRTEMLSNNSMLVLTSEQVNHVLEKPRIRRDSGRAFVVGKAAKDNSYVKERTPGHVIWIPLDKVTEMIEIPSE